MSSDRDRTVSPLPGRAQPAKSRAARQGQTPVEPAPASQRDEKAELQSKAIDLHMAGLPANKIAEHLGISAARVKTLIKAALAERVDTGGVSEAARTEIARIDQMIFGLWPQARRGQVEFVDRILMLQERREKLASPRPNKRELRQAFDRTVETSKELKDGVDDALVELGRTTVDQIDYVIAHGTPTDITKALYLQPHIMNALREMLATPAARNAAQKTDESDVPSKLRMLRETTGRQTKRGA